ncbi:unnamed protein product [Durusdinium trenchii]|uniref:Uncharacterized protein n=3 Tax=Durusdinium trenchii TaxID=1381693 RepID=A0ABP0T2E6_9DINO
MQEDVSNGSQMPNEESKKHEDGGKEKKAKKEDTTKGSDVTKDDPEKKDKKRKNNVSKKVDDEGKAKSNVEKEDGPEVQEKEIAQKKRKKTSKEQHFEEPKERGAGEKREGEPQPEVNTKKARSQENLVERQGTIESITALMDLASPDPKKLNFDSPGERSSSSTPLSTTISSSSGSRQKRQVDLSDDQKKAVADMQKPSDMDRGERKRQYSALRRAIARDAPPALVAKFGLCSDKERFCMLKAWLQNPDLDSIEVEEKYRSWVANLRTDRYVTVTVFQLEKLFGTSKEATEFIEQLITGQQGVPHPQAPNIKKARLYKVLKEVVEDKTTGQSTESGVKLSGRVRESAHKDLLKKQLGNLMNDDVSFMDLKTGAIKVKKPKKEKSPAEEAMGELKKIDKKLKGIINDLTAVQLDMKEHNVRNSAELVECLKDHMPKVEKLYADSQDRLQVPLSQVDPEDLLGMVNMLKEKCKPVDSDLKDAKRRVVAAKPKKKKAKADGSCGSDDGRSD